MSDKSFMPDEPEVLKRAHGRKRKLKPYTIWYRSKPGGLFAKQWFKFGSYETEKIAQETLRAQQRKNDLMEYCMGDNPDNV